MKLNQPVAELLSEHLHNSIACADLLARLFANIATPDALVAAIRATEENGDALTAAIYERLDSQPHSELVQLTQSLMKHLDDIVDRINDTARLIDIFTPTTTEHSAIELLGIISEMLGCLAPELAAYPALDSARVRACRVTIKEGEQQADAIYHQWRKAHRRHGTLPLISETDWTEILGLLEQTTDTCYHVALLLERISMLRQRQAAG